ncbi:MAG: aldo/keto reductase [Paenibacillus macerans]|uniref:Aldo/keto reductase family protein n=1 Tax=Paenibacillus macerans TaxID=44252 RepID=A0A090YRG7_PAEMA|nr:aldo/keto reductase [Paenibacillus macerans]KFM94705.1 aldo/keto reductase family protein [Paenibacillus macerans]MCY7558616.1 aldo/keto reductase [Paenibacillus macerans]MDU7473159.1 aldo/keto reductase [Paenibacillus macerans]MEC0139807.1 aldo/keto reductase [Paenibacillus macerans]MEC0150818.1 aldo/keto reductase [Paenibacillus macerans]
MDFVTLNNGVKMPQLGFGVWQVKDEEATAAVAKALEVGYTSIDTAMIYRNEVGVGKAIKQSSVPRENLFITTKVWNADQGYDNTLRAFDESLERLGLDYIDLYLIHWPTPKFDQYVDTYKALEKLYRDGRAKAIGVCNFEIEHLERLLNETEIKPVLNQVECHPHLSQNELKAFCAKHDIFIEAWSPLEQGGDVLKDPVVKEIAEAHGKTAAQVVLRWHLQNNTIVIPKSVTPSRIEENFNVFDFKLADSDMERINKLNINRRKGSNPNEMHVR